ncbi:TetR/AcrR family transcriptional regulator [Anaerocolumna sp. AGMB13020]|uniref:TetR/AcrR family transcriptional regulator n=1 Tax=Anaerocolumna sp. AGMB13020 TaxID=3081750 RepID=UPI002952E5C6|nr:TetR/AcrR family transcriptional regulator [Anaerocolumna sp. AGMB13020]WOO35198.1 TetR/AcrR family transcriptional regulator [Anaerocolumna sp. AGMB13020]
MGSLERKAKEKVLRREDIISAAENVFFAKGYNATTMDDVAKEAQFSKRTLYMYFNSKDQLQYEIMARGYRLFLELLESEGATKSNQTPLEGIKTLFLLFHKFSLSYPHHFRAIMEYQTREEDFITRLSGEAPQAKEECYELGEDAIRFLIRHVKAGVRQGVIRNDIPAEKIALILWSCTLGIFNTANKKNNYLSNYYSTTGEELLQDSFTLILDSLTRK